MTVICVLIIILGILTFPLCGRVEAEIDLISGAAEVDIRAYGTAFHKRVTAIDVLLKRIKSNEQGETAEERKIAQQDKSHKIGSKRALIVGGGELIKAVRVPKFYFMSCVASSNPVLAAYSSAAARMIYCSTSAILKERYSTEVKGDFDFGVFGTELFAFAALSVETNLILLIFYGISSIIKYVNRRKYEKRKRGYRRGERA